MSYISDIEILIAKKQKETYYKNVSVLSIIF